MLSTARWCGSDSDVSMHVLNQIKDILVYLKKKLNGNVICLIQSQYKIKMKHEWQLIEINITDYYNIKILHAIYRKIKKG